MPRSQKPSVRFTIVLLMICMIAGCSKTPSWFTGKYQFDLETTTKEIEQAEAKTKSDKKDDGLFGAAMGLAMSFAPLALATKFGGSTITITSNEIIITKDGNGTVVKFEVFERPTKDSVSIKTSEGKVETWMKTKTGLAKKAEGDVAILVHFKRQP